MNRAIAGAPVLTAAAMRRAEETHFAGGATREDVMARAAGSVARETARFSAKRPVLVLAGPGNNGGDAYGAAAMLQERGHDVAVAALGRPADGAAAAMAARWGGAVVSLADAAPRPVVVDGLFGIGLTRPLGPDVAEPLRRLMRAAAFRLAIDLPSGIASDDGRVMGPDIAADATLALGALKPAHLLMPGAARCGHVLLDRIGIGASGDATAIARPVIAPPATGAHKYSRGMVVVIGGAMPGAARLAARAALRGGAGYVVGCGVAGGEDAIVHRPLDALDDLLADDRVGAVVIGPGLGRDARARELLDRALASPRPLVVDGDALSMLGRDCADRIAGRAAPSVLTPHGGEFDRCFGGPGGKLERTRLAAADTGAVVVHKGPDTVIAWPDGRAVMAGGMTSWLSTAGTGDVLAGLIAARLACGGGAADAVWLHARAAVLAGPAFAADDLVRHLPDALGECR